MAPLLSALALAFLATSAIAQQQMEVAEFNAGAYNEMIDCVKHVSDKYEIAIHDGTVVVVPPKNGTIDLDCEADHKLNDCLHKHSPYVHMAIDDNRDCEKEGAVIQPLPYATPEWAKSHGAQGMRVYDAPPGKGTRNAEPEAGSGTLLARADKPKNYFFALADHDDDKCAHHDQINTAMNQCKSFGSPFRSIRFSNPDPNHAIRVTFWPHHDCAEHYKPPGKDGRSVSVAKNAHSDCIDHPKQTFSWRGKLA